VTDELARRTGVAQVDSASISDWEPYLQNEQHVIVNAAVILAALVCVEPSSMSTAHECAEEAELKEAVILQTAPDGRCFFTSLFLLESASPQQRRDWSKIERNTNGTAKQVSRIKHEASLRPKCTATPVICVGVYIYMYIYICLPAHVRIRICIYRHTPSYVQVVSVSTCSLAVTVI
jgi:hypothetical protein